MDRSTRRNVSRDIRQQNGGVHTVEESLDSRAVLGLNTVDVPSQSYP